MLAKIYEVKDAIVLGAEKGTIDPRLARELLGLLKALALQSIERPNAL